MRVVVIGFLVGWEIQNEEFATRVYAGSSLSDF